MAGTDHGDRRSYERNVPLLLGDTTSHLDQLCGPGLRAQVAKCLLDCDVGFDRQSTPEQWSILPAALHLQDGTGV